MKKLLACATLTFLSATSPAHAYLPPGCYAANGMCWNLTYLSGDCFSVNSFTHGFYINSMCGELKAAQSDAGYYFDLANFRTIERNQCYDNNAVVLKQRDEAIAAFAIAIQQRDQASASLNAAVSKQNTFTKKQSNLIKRLRAACGSKCAKIK